LATIVTILISCLGNIIPADAIKNNHQLIIINFVLIVISAFFSILVSLGIIKASLALIDGKKAEFKDLFSLSDKVIKMFLASMLYCLIVFGGLILFIVPGLIWGLQFSLYKYFIVEKNAGPIEALKLSSQATAGAKWNLLLFSFVCAGVNILGFMCLFVGLFFTIPLTWVAMSYVYRQLIAQTEIATPTAEIK
jgi:uncharacterized membrane protein